MPGRTDESPPIQPVDRTADRDELPPTVRAYFEALNAEDWDRLSAVWADDAELAAVGSRPRRGRAEVMAYFDGLFDPWLEHVDRPTRIIAADDTVVVEVEFSGVTRSGKKVTFDAVDIFDLGWGEIVKLATWYDLSWVRKQL